MSKLEPLRARLNDLSRRRYMLRVASVAAGLLLAIFWTLSVMLLADWRFEFDKPQRLVLLAVGAAAIVWAWRRFCRPLLGKREDELEMALLVERQQRIDSDLVAALQFESPAATAWGSHQLETAVIDYVAEFGRELDVYEGLPTDRLRRRATLLGVTALVVLIAAWALPGHLSAFFNRLLLGSRHYPTRTLIERVVVNGQDFTVEALANRQVKSPYWEPLHFEVHCAGEIPPDGLVRMQAATSGAETEIPLQPVAERQGVFTGRLDRLVDSLDYQLFLGDAWTDAARIEVIPLPVVNLELTITPPAYAASEEQTADRAATGARQIAVIEGSRVDLRLTSDKPLKSAVLLASGKQIPLVRDAANVRQASTAADDEAWRLAAANSPLARINEPLKYEVQVVDVDGLRLKDPLQGFIRIKADRAPRVTAAVVTQHVLPTAKPSISYGASDDYGVARLRLHRQVVRQDGQTSDNITSDDIMEIPLARPEKMVRSSLPLDLAPLSLAKGDQLKLTFEAIDYRGSAAGKSALSEPLVLHVTDERGVLAAMVEADERSARQLDAIIQRQLGIGDSP